VADAACTRRAELRTGAINLGTPLHFSSDTLCPRPASPYSLLSLRRSAAVRRPSLPTFTKRFILTVFSYDEHTISTHVLQLQRSGRGSQHEPSYPFLVGCIGAL
jgi:hypothetical protein